FGLLPSGCSSVDITIHPDEKTVTVSDATVTVQLPAGQHSASGVLHRANQAFPSDKPDPVFIVPSGLGNLEVALIFGSQVSGGVQVSGPGINCPGRVTSRATGGRGRPGGRRREG